MPFGLGALKVGKGLLGKAKKALKKKGKKGRKKALKRAAKGEPTHRIKGAVEALGGAEGLLALGQRFLPGGAPIGGISPMEQMAQIPGAFAGIPMKGHMTKKGVWSNRRRPRMHVTNPKALRRALRRAEGFGRLARRYVQLRTKHRFKPPKSRKGIAA